MHNEKFLSDIGGARMSPGFVPSGEFPKELGFYRRYVKKPELDEGRFQNFIEEYGGHLRLLNTRLLFITGVTFSFHFSTSILPELPQARQ